MPRYSPGVLPEQEESFWEQLLQGYGMGDQFRRARKTEGREDIAFDVEMAGRGGRPAPEEGRGVFDRIRDRLRGAGGGRPPIAATPTYSPGGTPPPPFRGGGPPPDTRLPRRPGSLYNEQPVTIGDVLMDPDVAPGAGMEQDPHVFEPGVGPRVEHEYESLPSGEITGAQKDGVAPGPMDPYYVGRGKNRYQVDPMLPVQREYAGQQYGRDQDRARRRAAFAKVSGITPEEADLYAEEPSLAAKDERFWRPQGGKGLTMTERLQLMDRKYQYDRALAGLRAQGRANSDEARDLANELRRLDILLRVGSEQIDVGNAQDPGGLPGRMQNRTPEGRARSAEGAAARGAGQAIVKEVEEKARGTTPGTGPNSGKAPVPAGQKGKGPPIAVLRALNGQFRGDVVKIHNELVRRGYDPDA